MITPKGNELDQDKRCDKGAKSEQQYPFHPFFLSFFVDCLIELVSIHCDPDDFSSASQLKEETFVTHNKGKI